MGIEKCVCCGRDAKHEYLYYVGEKIDYKKGVNWKGAYETTTTYQNVRPQSGYLCTRCCNGLSWPTWGLVICGILLFLFTIRNPDGVDERGGDSLIILGIIFIVAFIQLVIKIVRRIMGKGLKYDKGVEKVIEKLDKTKAENTKYFTNAEYKNLKSI